MEHGEKARENSSIQKIQFLRVTEFGLWINQEKNLGQRVKTFWKQKLSTALALWIIFEKKNRGLVDHPIFRGLIKMFRTFGLRIEKVIFNQRNKACFPLFCVWFYAIKEMVHYLAYSIELWMHLESWESTQISRVALGYRLEQDVRSFRAPPTSCTHP